MKTLNFSNGWQTANRPARTGLILLISLISSQALAQQSNGQNHQMPSIELLEFIGEMADDDGTMPEFPDSYALSRDVALEPYKTNPTTKPSNKVGGSR